MKKNIAVIFGGVNCEHDISIITGIQLINFLDDELYNIIPIYISKTGEWYSDNKLLDLDNYPLDESKLKEVFLTSSSRVLYQKKGKNLKPMQVLDFGIFAVHGINGEDGTLSGLFELNNIPYLNSSLIGSSITLDKSIFKDFIVANNIPSVKSITLYESLFYHNIEESIFNIESSLKFPLIIKPSNLGSSIGVKVCKSIDNLLEDINFAFQFDNKILIEEFIQDIKEINIAVYKYFDDFVFSYFEQPITNDKLLTFEDKYIGGETKGMESLKRIFPKELNSDLEKKIKDYVKVCYNNLSLNGIVRFDFILDKKDNIYLNEINSTPGSFANYLFKNNEQEFRKILNNIIEYTTHTHFQNSHKIKYFESSVLNGLQGIKK